MHMCSLSIRLCTSVDIRQYPRAALKKLRTLSLSSRCRQWCVFFCTTWHFCALKWKIHSTSESNTQGLLWKNKPLWKFLWRMLRLKIKVKGPWSEPIGQLFGSREGCTVGNKTNSFFFFWPHCEACGILVPRSGIEPTPVAVKMWSPNHWITREVPNSAYF